jgi:hypothetical protein
MDIHALITKRFQTTMIGSLHQFEKYFGHLWGIDLDEDELTNHQMDLRDRWENARNQILNNGNNQLRQMLNDIDHNNNLVKTQYHYKFYTNNNKNI